jgi:hypothetical protein
VPTGHLDLQTAGDDEFSPEGLRSNLERAYKVLVKSKPVFISAVEPYRVSRPSAIFFGMRAAAHHVAALATWRDRRRTAWFAAGYFAAWYFHLLLFAVLAVLIVLIVHPPARVLLFPHAPELVGPQPYLDSDKIVDKLAPVSILVTNQVAGTRRSRSIVIRPSALTCPLQKRWRWTQAPHRVSQPQQAQPKKATRTTHTFGSRPNPPCRFSLLYQTPGSASQSSSSPWLSMHGRTDERPVH